MSLNIINDNIYNTLVHSAKIWPNHLAVADEYGELTYSQLYNEVEFLKKELVTRGALPGCGVALITKNNRYFIIGLYAALACDCVVMPLANYQKPEEIKKALAEANIHFILTDNSGFSKLDANIKSISNSVFYFSVTSLSTFTPTGSFIQHAAVMRFTSGTTGNARCVILSHKSVTERIEAANEGLGLTENDRVIWVLPMAYHFIVSIMLYVRYGCGIIICNDFLAENILEHAQKHGGTFLYASPMHIRLLAMGKKDYSLQLLKRVISTTTAISPAVCKQFEATYNLPVSQAFGIIEVGLPIINLQQSSEYPEAVGVALPAFTVSVLDDAYKTVPSGEIGHLAIKGPGMFDGYLSPPTTRDDVLKNGWFLTGDLATLSKDGLIEIKGRTKNVINVSGNKVFPNEVEEVINIYSHVINSKVYGQKHPLTGELVCADIMLSTNSDFDEEDLINHCRKVLSPFKIPQRINVVDHIEMTASGKIKRQ
ncbi:MAG TPA: class I adenylate-forming enzyme family protein [Cyclobacteriaceae bacterium]